LHLGEVEIPDFDNDLQKIAGYAKTIYEEYKTNEIPKNDNLAIMLGYKSKNSGAFEARLRALRLYGFLEGRGTYRVSELAKQATYGDEAQKAKALLTAFRLVWGRYHDRYRFELPRGSDSVARLATIAKCEPAVMAGAEKHFRELFEADANFITSIKTEHTMGEELTPPDQQLGSESSAEMEPKKAQFIEIKAGPYYSRMPYTEVGRDTIRAFLDSLTFQDETGKVGKAKKEEK
jgi:hypothetical protein